MEPAKAVSSEPAAGRAYPIFAEAIELEPDNRARFIADQCRDDSVLRREVEGLLNVAAGESIDTLALRDMLPAAGEQSLTGTIIGRFRLEEQIGQGGMGVVYRAERTDGVKQSVAIKLVSSTLAAAAQLRFEREAHLLARVEHPSIARLIDAGIEDSRAWIAIEFVQGERIDQYCHARALPPREIVRLLVKLTDAVGAAHRRLVVHSDIKPANVLVTAEGLPKLVDFGISTALRDASEANLPTVNIARLFSPNYAAPEQVHGVPLTVGTDIFGLGALAYRLLTGVPPYADARTPIAYLLAVTQRDVETASRSALAAGRDASHVRDLRGDLDAILSKALDRDPARRYPSTAALQEDLQNYLEQRPVLARRPSMLYRAGKFLRRNAVVASLSVLLTATVVAGGLFAAAAARRADLARDIAARRGEFLEGLLGSADPRNGRRDISIGELLDTATHTLHAKFVGEPLVEASMLGLIADTYDGLGRYAEALEASRRQVALLLASGGSHLDMGHALRTQGEVLREQGRWTDAEPVMRSAVALLRSEHQPAELAGALDILGIVLMHVRQQSEAQRVFLEEIELEAGSDQALQDHRSYPYFALAVMYGDLGRYPEALDYSRRAVDLAKRTLPADHQDLLAFEAEYASILLNDGHADGAEPLLRDIVTRDRRVSGPQHKDTLMHQQLLADSLLQLHRETEAAPLAKSSAEGLEALLGPDNMYALSAWQTYGSALCRGSPGEPGLSILRRIEETRRHLPAADEHVVHVSAVATGDCLRRLKRYQEAETVLVFAAAGLESSRGPQFRYTQTAYGSLRDLYLSTGRGQDAAVYQAKLGP